MERIFGVEILSRNFLSLYINLAILLFLVLGISGTIISYHSQTNNFVIAIDNSESMKTADILPSRLDAAKTAASELINNLPAGSEISVVKFSGKTEVLSPPDISKIKADSSLENIQPDGLFGTDFEEVLYTSNFLFENQRKNLIVITDGQINSANLERTVQYAKDNDIVVNSIAIGTVTGGLTEVGTISKLDEYSLQKLAFETNGQYIDAKDMNSIEGGINKIFQGYDGIVYVNISTYLFIGAIILFSINWLLHNFRFRTFP
jgi:Ca-activated chloride channel family protein